MCVNKHLHYRQEYRTTFIIPGVSSIIMGACSFLIYHIGMALIHSNTISCLIALLAAVIIYFMLILLLGGLKESDLPDFPMGMRIGRLAKKLHLM